MILTKSQLLREVELQNVQLFKSLMYHGDSFPINELKSEQTLDEIQKYLENSNALNDIDYISNDSKNVYNLNMGDGNDLIICDKFTFENEEPIYIQLEGYYSSWDDSEFDKVYVAEPYEYTEVRYRKLKDIL